MFSTEDLEKIKEQIYQYKVGATRNNIRNEKEKPGDNKNNTKCGPSLNPSEILVIAGLLSGALEVSSVSLSRDQIVQVSLEGSLRRQTQLEQVMEQVGKCTFEEVMRAMLKGMN